MTRFPGPFAAEFQEMRQGRVRRLLLDHADDPEVIGVFPQA